MTTCIHQELLMEELNGRIPLAVCKAKVIIQYSKIITTGWCLWLAPKHGYQNKRLHMRSGHLPRISTSQLSTVLRPQDQRVGPIGPSMLNWYQTTWVSTSTMQIPSRWTILSNIFISFFGLKVNNDTVFEAMHCFRN